MEEYKNTPEDSSPDIQAEKSDLSFNDNNQSGPVQGGILAAPPVGGKLYFSANKKVVLKVSLAALGLLILGGAVYFGFRFYEKGIQKVTVEKILPKDPNGVIKVSINPQAEQFQLLESDMQKFPGYGILKKKIDESGEGKTITELFFEQLKEKNLDFEADIKPAIGEQAYVVFPDMSPLFKNISREVVKFGNNFYATAADKNIFKKSNPSKGMVMGAVDDYSGEPLIPLDFIMASNIRDNKKAQEVIKKIKNNSEYETETKKFRGYEYVRVKIKNIDNNKEGSYLNYIETFHAVLGGNWIMTSKEDYLREAIDRRKEQSLWGGVFSKDKRGNLTEDESFKKVFSEIGESNKDSIMLLYTKLNFEKIFGDNECESSFCMDTKYLKYPQDIINGFSLTMESDGIKINASSNRSSLNQGEIKNKNQEQSLAAKLPAKAGDAWLDVMVEHNDLKNFYYNFKKNNLTEEGIKKLNEVRGEIKTETGIDFEADIIDIFSDSVGFSLFTSAERLPEGVISANISSKEKMLGTMEKLVELSKVIQLSQMEMMSYSGADFGATSRQAINTQDNKEMQALMNEISASHLEEIKIPEGTIFSYKPVKNKKLPLSEYLPDMVFSLEDNFMIFGSSYIAVESFVRGIKNKDSQKLAEGKYYSQAAKKFYPENYLTTYVNMFGILNAVNYFAREFEKSMDEARQVACQAQNSYLVDSAKENGYDDFCSPSQIENSKNETREYLFAAGAFLRTLNIISVAESLGDNSKKQTLFIHLKEISPDDKKRAEKVLDKLN